MIRINLLPHREMRRERRKREFIGHAVGAALLGATVVFAGGMVINGMIDTQNDRNAFISAAIKKLDIEIAEIQELESTIAALQARQKAVEDLQSNRTIPVHLFDELVKLTPEGVFLNKLVQEDLRVAISGNAQSNERVAELLRNLSDRSPWLEKPQLEEIKEVSYQEPSSRSPAQGAKPEPVKKAYEFTLNALLKRSSTAVGADGQPVGNVQAAVTPAGTPGVVATAGGGVTQTTAASQGDGASKVNK